MNETCDKCGKPLVAADLYRVELSRAPCPEYPEGYNCEVALCQSCYLNYAEDLGVGPTANQLKYAEALGFGPRAKLTGGGSIEQRDDKARTCGELLWVLLGGGFILLVLGFFTLVFALLSVGSLSERSALVELRDNGKPCKGQLLSEPVVERGWRDQPVYRWTITYQVGTKQYDGQVGYKYYGQVGWEAGGGEATCREASKAVPPRERPDRAVFEIARMPSRTVDVIYLPSHPEKYYASISGDPREALSAKINWWDPVFFLVFGALAFGPAFLFAVVLRALAKVLVNVFNGKGTTEG